MGIHTYVWHLLTEAKPKTSSIKSDECLICKIKSCVITRKDDKIDTFLPPQIIPINQKKQNESNLEFAKKVNNFGKIIFVLISILFNLVFWSVAIFEFSKPAKAYLDKE